MNVARFLLRQMLGLAFWQMVLASFTVVLMMAWRASLRDQIFKAASKYRG